VLDPREIVPETARPLRRSEYDQLVQLGLLEGERVELLEGVIVQMSPHGPPHDSTIERLNELLVLALRGRAKVRVQSAFAASDHSEPEPDFAIVPPGQYDREHPRVAWLIIEVSESSLKKDSGAKARVYAASAVEAYWVVNLVDRVVEVFTQPQSSGYAVRETVGLGGSLTVVRFPDVTIAVKDVLPA